MESSAQELVGVTVRPSHAPRLHLSSAKHVQVGKYKFHGQHGEALFGANRLRSEENLRAEAVRMLAPKPLCEGVAGPIDFGDPRGCFARGMVERLRPYYARMAEHDWLCDADKGDPSLGPHQVIALELARVIADKWERGQQAQIGNRRGLLVWHNTGSGKCFSAGTPIMMADGSVRAVEEVRVGDEVMGDDSTPRRVLSLGRGRQQMFDIVPSHGGEAWGCNASHVLVLEYLRHKTIAKTSWGTFTARWHEPALEDDGVTPAALFRTKNFDTREAAADFLALVPDDHRRAQMEVRAYLGLSSTVRHALKCYRAAVDFGPAPDPLCDPYVLGAWLGDGSLRHVQITSADPELVDELRARLRPAGVQVVELRQKDQYSLTTDPGRSGRKPNALRSALLAYGLLGKEKRIPETLKRGSRETRLAVLAGLLDAAGHLAGNCYEIWQKSEALARDVAFVARTLGFGASLVSRVKAAYWRVGIYGAGLEAIPVALRRKRAAPRRQIKNAQRYGFEVVPRGEGQYYGFAVDGNHRFLLGDTTVTHNTVTCLGIALAYWGTQRKIVLTTTPANKADNNLAEYAKNLLVYFPERAREIAHAAGAPLPPTDPAFPGVWTTAQTAAGHPTHAAFSAWCSDAGAALLGKRIKCRTFVELATDARLGGREYSRSDEDFFVRTGAVVIMDEAQSLFLPKKANEVAGYNGLRAYLEGRVSGPHARQDPHARVHLYALSATPGDTVQDYLRLLNVVRPAGSREFTPADAGRPQVFKNLVLYADIRGDTSHYGQLAGGAPQNVRVPMTPAYYAAFLKAFAGETVRDYGSAPESKKSGFLAKAKQASNFLTEAQYRAFFTPAHVEAVSRPTPGMPVPALVRVDRSKVMLSDKTRVALRSAVQLGGKQYVYTSDARTLKALGAALDALGYERVTLDHMDHVGGGRSGTYRVSLRSPKPRYIAFKTGTLHGDTMEHSHLSALKAFFNDEANKDGRVCKILLATGEHYQGLNLFHLRGVHILDPLFQKSADEQAVGRALRYCGHAAGETSVVVQRYFGVAPRDFDLDKALDATGSKAAGRAAIQRAQAQLGALVSPLGASANANSLAFHDSERRAAPLARFQDCLRAMAVDCALLDPSKVPELGLRGRSVQFQPLRGPCGACDAAGLASASSASRARSSRASGRASGWASAVSRASSASRARSAPSRASHKAPSRASRASHKAPSRRR